MSPRRTLDLPGRIAICAVQGDYIDWPEDREPHEGDCPFGECGCTPVVYLRIDGKGEVNQ